MTQSNDFNTEININLDVNKWSSFSVSDIFYLFNGKGITTEEIESHPGDLAAVQSGADNNGCIGKIDETYCKNQKYTYTKEPCLTVARTGTAGFVAYQSHGCVVGDSAKILLLKEKKQRNTSVYLFLRTILMKLQYKYTYGRKVTEKKYLVEKICLPVTSEGKPDWDFMKRYMESLNCKMPTTTVTANNEAQLNVNEWKEFLLHKLFKIEMGNGIDAVITTSDNPKYNYVSRDSNGNGVVAYVDEIEGETPFTKGAMSIALGGSFLGSCFIQKKDFYTAQNVAVLQEKVKLSNHVKLFIATLIRKECMIKYQAFGRELNSHLKKDFTIKLPVKRDESGIVYDEAKEFSDNGYIPDFEWIDKFMKLLPYSDRIPENS